MSTTSYSDLATIGHCIATTGGELRYYPMFKVSDPNCPLVTGCIVHWSQVVLSTGHRLYCPLVTGFVVHWSQVVLPTGHRLCVHWSQVVLSTGHKLYCPLVTGCVSTGHRLYCPLVTGCIVHWSQVVLSTGHRLYCPLVTGCIVNTHLCASPCSASLPHPLIVGQCGWREADQRRHWHFAEISGLRLRDEGQSQHW